MTLERVFTLTLVALALTACTETTDPLEPEAGPPGPVLDLTSELHRVVGSGHVESSAGLREFTFHAAERPGDAVGGSFKVVLPNGLFFEADVTCLAVDGATGWVGGVVRDTNAGVVQVGSTSMFYAVDGGEGAGAGDVVSLAAFNQPGGADLGFCQDRPLELPPLQVTGGNVQVR